MKCQVAKQLTNNTTYAVVFPPKHLILRIHLTQVSCQTPHRIK